MLRLLVQWIVGSRRGRYWLRKLSEQPELQPILDLAANRTVSCLRGLRDLGFQPDTVIDVGAYRGEWTAMALPVFPSACFIMVEAQADKASALRDLQARAPGRVRVEIGLLGAQTRAAAEFFIAETGSSLYIENTSFARKHVTLPMTTLDAILDRHKMTGRCLIKLDVQGAELNVLAGATLTLERTDAILLEASLVEYSLDAPRIREVIEHMATLGFLLFDICDLRRIGRVLAQADLIFVRTGSVLDQCARTTIQAYGSSNLEN